MTYKLGLKKVLGLMKQTGPDDIFGRIEGKK